MKRRMFFGALAAVFCPISAVAQTVPLSDFEKVRQLFLNVNGQFDSFRFRDWRPGPKYETGVDRVPGRFIWVSPKRSISNSWR